MRKVNLTFSLRDVSDTDMIAAVSAALEGDLSFAEKIGAEIEHLTGVPDSYRLPPVTDDA